MESTRLIRSLAGVVLSSSALAAALFATPAAAAPLPVHLGQVGSESTTAYATSAGGCDCTVAQFGDAGPAAKSYAIPYDGVITASAFYLGQTIEAGNTVQVQTAHPTGASAGTVASEGTAHGLLGLTPSTVHAFAERVPARAGDVLAARFHSSYYIQTTPYFFKTAASGDLAAVAGPTAAGGSFTSGPPVAERRLNLEAVLEPDEDHDGYGDASQDLCPGSPIATGACSGSLYGSDLQGERSAAPPGCSCMEVQTAIGGASTAAPSDGVVVRWRVLNAESGPYTLRVVSYLPGSSGGMYRAYRVLHSSATENVTAPAGPLFSKISSFPTRLPIPAGTYLGLGGRTFGFQASGGGATYSQVENLGDGLATVGETHNGTFLYDADIEPDVDSDGYGDITQDSCPTSAAVHEGPCPVVSAPGEEATPTPVGTGQAQAETGPGPIASVPAGPARPVRIESLAVKPRSFHVRPLGPVRARGHWGSEVKLSLSSAATVTLAIEARHGRRFHVVTRLSTEAAAGRDSVRLSGRYRRAGKVTDLAPGTYRLTAEAKGAAGTGPVKRTTFTVLPPA